VRWVSACGNDGWDDDRCPERRSVQAGGDILERAKDVDTVVFDKTGTLTKGEMELTDVVVFDGDGQPITDGGQLTGRDRLSENDVLRLAATAESGSEHPRPAIVDGARDRGIDVSDPDDFENVPGHGIRATVGDSEVLVGNRKFLRDNGIDPRPLRKRWSASNEGGEDGDARRPRARWHGRGRTRRCGR